MIVSGELLYKDPVEAHGLLFIGDPHVSSKRPGRRKDASWPAPIMAKLEHCVEFANEHQLVPIFAGDIFDDPHETDEALKTRLARLMKRFWMLPITNVGNHDIRNTRLSDGDSLAYFAVSDNIDAIAESGPVCVFSIAGKKVGLGMTPYGQAIPTSVRGVFQDVDSVIWITHHDIAFQANYPNCVKPFPIDGCDTVLNGHIHNLKTAEKAGDTIWRNLGNINRMSSDLLEQEPAAWIVGWDGVVTAVPLPHVADVFDMTGRLVEAASSAQVVKAVESVFVSLLHAETTGEMAQTADGSVLLEEMEAKFERDKTPVPVRSIVLSLLREATGGISRGGQGEAVAAVEGAS